MQQLVYGVGINDADYVVRKGGVFCPFYVRWSNMLKRCYNKASLLAEPSYENCYVGSEWLIFSNFKAWMEKQDHVGKHLDKDLLSKGSNCYSKHTCCFITTTLNNFLINDKGNGLPSGVCLDKSRGNYIAQVCNPFTKKNEYLGRFTSPEEAHNRWKTRKHELACQLANEQLDSRIALALRGRYAQSK